MNIGATLKVRPITHEARVMRGSRRLRPVGTMRKLSLPAAAGFNSARRDASFGLGGPEKRSLTARPDTSPRLKRRLQHSPPLFESSVVPRPEGRAWPPGHA